MKFRSIHIAKLNVDERLVLIEDLWDSLDEDSSHIPLTPGQKAELDTRLDKIDAGDDDGIPWDEVLDRVRRKVLMKSQHGPVRITRDGKPSAVVLSEIEYRELKLKALRATLIEGEESGDAGEFDVTELKAQARREAGLSSDAEETIGSGI